MSARSYCGIAVVAMLIHPYSLAQESRLEEVIVTSTALRENPLELAQPTSVLAGDDLRRQIAASIGETLSGELGVSSSYFGPGTSRPIIRGLGGERVQVLQDGIASLDVSSLSQDHAVTLEAVVSQQIEVIKGPATLLYGSGAAGGLINVVSNRVPLNTPARPLSGAAEIRGDTAADERTAALSLDSTWDRLAFHADYFDRKTQDVEIPGFAQSAVLRRTLLEAGLEPDGVRGHIANSDSDAQGGALGAAFLGEIARGGASFSRHESTYGIPGEEQAFIDMRQDRYDTRAELMLDGAIEKLRFAGAYNDYAHTEFEAPGQAGTIFDQQAYELRLAVDHSLGALWRGTAGLQYLDLDFAALGEEAFVPTAQTRTFSIFGFQERHAEHWTIELGARAERQQVDVDPASALPDFRRTALSLSTGGVWKVAPGQVLALNVTRTQRNPQTAELYANGPHLAAQRFEIGSADLDLETALTSDLSWRHSGAELQWTLSAFYNDYRNYIYASPNGAMAGELPVFLYRQAGASFHGFEVEVIIPMLKGNGQHLELRLASDYVRGNLDDGADLPQIPPLRVGAGMHYERDAWHLGVQAVYHDAQNKVAEHELPTASFVLLDVDASYRLALNASSLFLFLRGTNLLDEQARQHASPLKDIAALPGRSFHLGARLEF